MAPFIAKMTSKNQLTLPRRATEAFGDISYFEISVSPGALILRPARFKAEGSSLKAAREKMRRLGITEDVVAEAVRWARKGRA